MPSLLGVLPKSQVPRRIKPNMDPMSQMFQWLRKEERQKGIKDSETAHLFTDNRKELKQLADAIRRQELNAASRVEVMSGGEALSTALIAWLKEEDEDIGIAMRVVEAVWTRVCQTKFCFCKNNKRLIDRASSSPSRLDTVV